MLVTAPSGAQMKGKVRSLAPTVDAATRTGLVWGPARRSGASVGQLRPSRACAHAVSLSWVARAHSPCHRRAVVVRDGFSYVSRVGADNRVSQLKVQTGRVVGDQIEIKTGIKLEDKLVASGGGFLSDGDLVKVVDAAKPLTRDTKECYSSGTACLSSQQIGSIWYECICLVD
ncbi:MAG: hypothetical protein IPO43_15340 [Rhodoferax sp.]|nr:hypothetical protein [Rhodoferax sp.]